MCVCVCSGKRSELTSLKHFNIWSQFRGSFSIKSFSTELLRNTVSKIHWKCSYGKLMEPITQCGCLCSLRQNHVEAACKTLLITTGALWLFVHVCFFLRISLSLLNFLLHLLYISLAMLSISSFFFRGETIIPKTESKTHRPTKYLSVTQDSDPRGLLNSLCVSHYISLLIDSRRLFKSSSTCVLCLLRSGVTAAVAGAKRAFSCRETRSSPRPRFIVQSA